MFELLAGSVLRLAPVVAGSVALPAGASDRVPFAPDGFARTRESESDGKRGLESTFKSSAPKMSVSRAATNRARRLKRDHRRFCGS